MDAQLPAYHGFNGPLGLINYCFVEARQAPDKT